MAKLRGMVTHGLKPAEGDAVQFVIELPGYAYEKFSLSEGAPVLWKSEPCEKGRRCRFAIAGESHMGFHAHDVTESLEVVTGILVVCNTEGTFHIGPGQSFSSPPDQIHSVGFCGFGEVIADWPEQETNELVIRIYQ
jgi:quercetin dioxygenase-like cupin family protein